MTKPYIIAPRRTNETTYSVQLREDITVELGTVGKDQLGWRAFHPVKTFWANYYVGRQAPKYPESEKLLAARPQAEIEGNLLDWLKEQGFFLGEYRCPHGLLQDEMPNCTESASCRNGEQDVRLWLAIYQMDELLARRHGVDLKKVEQERKEMLALYNNRGTDAHSTEGHQATDR